MNTGKLYFCLKLKENTFLLFSKQGSGDDHYLPLPALYLGTSHMPFLNNPGVIYLKCGDQMP
jgi:hypothetical protein